jgi:hypothetical protein
MGQGRKGRIAFIIPNTMMLYGYENILLLTINVENLRKSVNRK